jgi:hypothetical protein
MSAQVLVIDQDPLVGPAICELCTHEGYFAHLEPDPYTALLALRSLVGRAIVIWTDPGAGDGGALSFFESVVREVALVRHRYVYLTTSALGLIPRKLHALLDSHAIPIVSKPVDSDVLLTVLESTGPARQNGHATPGN